MMVLLKFALDLFGLLTPVSHCLVIGYLWFVVYQRLLVSASHRVPTFPTLTDGPWENKKAQPGKDPNCAFKMFSTKEISGSNLLHRGLPLLEREREDRVHRTSRRPRLTHTSFIISPDSGNPSCNEQSGKNQP